MKPLRLSKSQRFSEPALDVNRMPAPTFTASPLPAESSEATACVRWSPGKHPLEIPYFGNDFKCAMVFKRILADFVWHSMRSLLRSRVTLSQVQTILAGQSVGGLAVSEVLTIWRFCAAAKRLTDLVRSHAFRLDRTTAQELHNIAAGESHGSGAAKLSAPSDSGDTASDPLQRLDCDVCNPKERAIAAFPLLAGSRPFRTANTRTALLMMNGTLMSSGYLPVFVLDKDSEAFLTELKRFLENGDGDGLFTFFSSRATTLYQALPENELKPDPFPAKGLSGAPEYSFFRLVK